MIVKMDARPLDLGSVAFSVSYEPEELLGLPRFWVPSINIQTVMPALLPAGWLLQSRVMTDANAPINFEVLRSLCVAAHSRDGRESG